MRLLQGIVLVPVVTVLCFASLLSVLLVGGDAYALSSNKGKGSAGTKKPPVKKKAAPKPPAKKTSAQKPPTKVPPAKPVQVAATKPVVKPAASPLTDNFYDAAVEITAEGKGRINYDANVVKAMGMAAVAPPTLKKSRSQDILEAREAAVVDALRNLSMAVSRVRVTADTRMENYILKSDEVRVRLEAVIRGAQIIEEKVLPKSKVFRVIVQLRLRGPDSLLDALNAAEEEARRLALAEAEKKKDPFAPGMPAPDGAEFTGLIIDCRGLKISACPAPKLYDDRRNEVYGTIKVTPDFVNERGIVGYPRSLDAAKHNERVGNRPLIVRARGVADEHRFHPMISRGDAERIRDANGSSKFLERTAVVFLIDPIQY
ncbi:MAG: hypothetical protein OHK0029_40960 [Armatimonadaceae bacterium]